ncbi:MAG: SPFH domain-containing protein, partial [Spirochaetales bacterium]|nr:SPFH domain-containing protein [Spirochaetales bacterium]
GLVVLIVNTLAILIAIGVFVASLVFGASMQSTLIPIVLTVVSALYAFIIGPILYVGLKVLTKNEALVLTLFGRYYGTLKQDGFFFVNPFCVGFNPTAGTNPSTGATREKKKEQIVVSPQGMSVDFKLSKKKISLKALTLNNDKQKINDSLGNPIIIGVVVIWKVVDTAKAVFNVDNYIEYLSIQTDAALRDAVRRYPYDSEEDEMSLRGSANEVAEDLKKELQKKVEVAGLEIIETRITHLSYAPEIAAAMLQRQQATAIIAARKKIVEGAVGMVEMALEQLNAKGVVDLDEERKASMVSNLMVVLSSNRDTQPVVNTGSIY